MLIARLYPVRQSLEQNVIDDNFGVVFWSRRVSRIAQCPTAAGLVWNVTQHYIRNQLYYTDWSLEDDIFNQRMSSDGHRASRAVLFVDWE